MIETEAQQLCIDAVAEVGGQGVKFNNRFIIGVPDLLLQMPGHRAMILEAKLFKFSAKTIAAGWHIEDVGATVKQKMYLRDWGYAGMLTGVVSFVMEQGGNVSTLRMAVYSYEEMLKRDWSVYVEHHQLLGGKDERLVNIRQQLIGFADG